MICKHCNFSFDDEEAKVCPACGKPLVEEDDTEVFEREGLETVELEEEQEGQVHAMEFTAEDTYSYGNDDVSEKPAKKSKLGAIIAGCAGVLVIACIAGVLVFNSPDKSKDTDTNTNTEENSTAVSEDGASEEADHELGDYSSYLAYVSTLGDYKNIEVDMTPEEVTDEDVETQIASNLSASSTTIEVTDRDDVQTGDIVNIDYVGTLNGEAFDGGTYSGYDLTIGSGTFIDGFEDGLIGAKVGETVELNLTFPESYGNTELAGQDVVFTVTINEIMAKTTPELTDEWVAENSDYTTVDEYRQSVREGLEAQAIADVEDSKASRIMETIYSNSEFASYPQDEIDSYVEYLNSYYSYYASMYGTTLEEFVSLYYGMSLDEFNTELENIAKVNIGSEVICYCIAAQEEITLTEDEYNEAALSYAQDSGYETVEEFEAAYSKSDIYDRIMMDKVMEYLSENATEVTEETAE